ncbi:hypothetical protein GCM10020256_71790 [Streptomyces thermocoprophilus]
MKVACVGGGPAGLYLSILLKLQDPSHDITVFERDPEGSTYGWGVTYWRGLLDRLHTHDPVTARAVEEASVRWSDGVAHVRDLSTRHRGDQGHGIGRHRLLEILAARARSLGVRLEHGHEITGHDIPDADLVVAADGVRSALRTRYADHFGTDVRPGGNPYIWLGTTKVFDAFTFAFVETEHGWIWCYGYGYDAGHSTCVVECAPETHRGLGLDRATEADSLALLEKLFAHVLDGRPLIGRSQADAPRPLADLPHDHQPHLAPRQPRPARRRRPHHPLLHRRRHHPRPGGRHRARRRPARPRHPPAGPHRLRTRTTRRPAARAERRPLQRPVVREPAPLHRPAARADVRPARPAPLTPAAARPPQLYYRLDRAAGQLGALRRLKRRLGPRVARALHARRLAGRG